MQRSHGDVDAGDYDNFHSSATILFCQDNRGPMSRNVSEVNTVVYI